MSLGVYESYPYSDTPGTDTPTPEPTDAFAKAPPPPPDVTPTNAAVQGVQNPTVIGEVGSPTNEELLALNPQLGPVTSTQKKTDTTGLDASMAGGDFVSLGDANRYGTLNNKSPAQTAADQRKGGGCSDSWYAQAIQNASRAANVRSKRTTGITNPLCSPGKSEPVSMTEWDGIPRPPRLPFIITTQYRLEKGVPYLPSGSGLTGAERKDSQYIVFLINPHSINITQSIRGSEAKTRVGTVHYMWQDPLKRTFFDEPTFSFTFDSGNLLPWTYLNNPGATPQTNPMRVPPGLTTFYRFLTLLDEIKAMPDGRPNFTYITINTVKFPRMTLAGWFTPEGVSGVTDSADDPNHLTWSANFHCRATYPRLYNSLELMTAFRQATLPVPTVTRGKPGQETDVTIVNALEVARQLGTTRVG